MTNPLKIKRGFLVLQTVKNLTAVQETGVQPLSQEDPLEKGMATQCSILDWRIPWTEEPGNEFVILRSTTRIKITKIPEESYKRVC